MNIAIYTDNAPMKEEIVAAGLNRINTRYFTAINENISIITTSSEKNLFDAEDLSPILRDKTVFSALPKTLVKVLRRFDKLLEQRTGKYCALLFSLQKNRLIKAIKDSRSDVLFVPLGADMRGYIRAVALAKKSNLPLAVWIGDDFKNYAELSNNSVNIKLVDTHLKRCLGATAKFFVISEGLQRHMKETYGLESTVLTLPFHQQYDVNETVREKVVFFLGNASHFYQESLVDMMDVICDYNEQHDCSIVMRFSINTLPAIFTERHLKYIRHGQYPDDMSQSIAIAQSLFCIIPTSFAQEHKGMVSTSFPSKLMECMAYAKMILVYGPPYSSSVEYYKEHGLPEVIDTRDKSRLAAVLAREIEHPSDHSGSYHSALMRHHDYAAIKKTIMNGLKPFEEQK